MGRPGRICVSIASQASRIKRSPAEQSGKLLRSSPLRAARRPGAPCSEIMRAQSRFDIVPSAYPLSRRSCRFERPASGRAPAC